jgi:hypothetical protein
MEGTSLGGELVLVSACLTVSPLITKGQAHTQRAYALMLGQCLPKLISKIQGVGTYIQANQDQDIIQLLVIIQGYCCSFDNHRQSTNVLKGAKHRESIYYQGYDVTTTEYVEHFKALVGVVETYGGAYGNKPGLITASKDSQGCKTSIVECNK